MRLDRVGLEGGAEDARGFGRVAAWVTGGCEGVVGGVSRLVNGRATGTAVFSLCATYLDATTSPSTPRPPPSAPDLVPTRRQPVRYKISWPTSEASSAPAATKYGATRVPVARATMPPANGTTIDPMPMSVSCTPALRPRTVSASRLYSMLAA